MRWKRKLVITVLAAAASAIGGTEIAKKRFSNGKGAAYRKFLDNVIHYKNKEEGQAAVVDQPTEVSKADEAAVVDQPPGVSKAVEAGAGDQAADVTKTDELETDELEADEPKSDESSADQK